METIHGKKDGLLKTKTMLDNSVNGIIIGDCFYSALEE
jgi:hypothetical protein